MLEVLKILDDVTAYIALGLVVVWTIFSLGGLIALSPLGRLLRRKP
jgi:hypothetical protein